MPEGWGSSAASPRRRSRPRDAPGLAGRKGRIADLCVGWPAEAGEISPRLSLATTVIEDAYPARDLGPEIDAYDRRREELRPYRRQRNVARWGEAARYGWSEDKARQ